MNSKNITTLAAILTIAVLVFGTIQFAAAVVTPIKLVGKFSSVDNGKAKFELRSDGRKTFTVEIRDADLVPGDVYTIVVGTTFSETRTAVHTLNGNVLNLDLDSQCKDGPADNNCWDTAVKFGNGNVVTVSGTNVIATATLHRK